MHVDDRHIVQLMRTSQTSEEGMRMLVHKYRDRLYWYVRKLVVSHDDALDVLQDTLFNAFRYFHTYRGDSGLYTWLYKIATNESLKHIARRKTEVHNEQYLLNLVDDQALPHSDQVLVALQKAIHSLPVKQQTVFNLRYYEELSYKEIAQITGDSVDTLKANYFYAAKKIKEYMLGL